MEQNTVTNTENKTLTSMQKNQLLNVGRTIYRNVYRRRDALKERLDKIRQDMEIQLEKKTAKLREEIEELNAEKELWIAPKVAEMLHGFDIDDILSYEMKETDGGKKSLVVDFKYPDTIWPEKVDEGPEYDGAGFCGSEEELAADIERAAQAEAIQAMKDCTEQDEREMPDLRGTLVEDADGNKELVMTDEDMPIPGFEEAREDVAERINEAMAEDEEAREAAELEAMIDDPTVEDDDDEDDPWSDDDDEESAENEDDGFGLF